MDNDRNKKELEWVSRISEGKHSAFEKLFKCYYLPLTRFSWRYVGSKAISEELVQEIFFEIWEDRKNLNIVESVRSYLYKAVKHRSLNHLKHQRVKSEYDTKWMAKKKGKTTIEYEDSERIEQIKEAIEKAIEELPPRSQMTYKLHRYDGLTYQEIADVMDVSVKTVESQMTRTLKILRERLSFLLPFFLITVKLAAG